MYFSPDVEYSARRERLEYGRDEERYLQLFADATVEKRIGEASTHYMSSAVAPGLIREFDSNARIVCLLRNPADVAHAWHGERVFRGVEAERSFDVALLESENGAPYRDVGRYGSQLRRWIDLFGESQVHAILFEDFTRDTEDEFRRVLKFLDVDSRFQPREFGVHNAATSKSAVVPLLRTRPLRYAAGVARTVLGPPMARRLSRGVRRIPRMNGGSPRTPLTPEVRRWLDDHYGDEIEHAGQILGRDLLDLWLRPRSGGP